MSLAAERVSRATPLRSPPPPYASTDSAIEEGADVTETVAALEALEEEARGIEFNWQVIKYGREYSSKAWATELAEFEL